MNELTELELCKRIADIDGVKVIVECGMLWTDDNNVDKYNPLTNKALLWDLMVKYGVQKHQHKVYPNMSLIGIYDNFIYATNETIPRAVLLAIIESKQGE